MNLLNLLKLISKLLDGKTPSAENIACAKSILDSLIESNTPKEGQMGSSDLDLEAQQARSELQ